MGQTTYSPPPGATGTNWWQQNGDMSISPIAGVQGIEVIDGNDFDAVSTAGNIRGYDDGTNHAITQWTFKTISQSTSDGTNSGQAVISPDHLSIGSDDGGANFADIDIVPTDFSFEVNNGTLHTIIAVTAGQGSIVSAALVGILRAAVIISNTKAQLQQVAGGASAVLSVDTTSGFDLSIGGVTVFRINAAGHIWTSQVTASVVAPVATVAVIPIYDASGTLIGRIPVI